jgi:hypothetical protein
MPQLVIPKATQPALFTPLKKATTSTREERLAGAFVVWSKESSIGGSTVGATEAPTAQEGDRKIGQRAETNKDG